MAGWRTLVLAIVGAALVREAAAATVSVTRIERPRPGCVRIRLRYAAKDDPTFRLVPLCGVTATPASDWLVATTVRLDGQRSQATLELDDDLGWLVERTTPCRATGLAVQIVEDRTVVASARVPLELPPPRFVLPPAPPVPDRGSSRLGLAGQKQRAPQTRMSQASVMWSLSERISFHVSYERTAYAPIMSRDHDDGVLTGVRFRF